ncbi:MAG: hypothetical protein FWH04_08620 [Oscillospiraceae bacterium]|nr:hypothetical protein [Oscillospiraceae bacterium]
MECPKCRNALSQGLPCPLCGYTGGSVSEDRIWEILDQGFEYDEEIGMYYQISPGDNGGESSVTWYDPATGQYEVLSYDAEKTSGQSNTSEEFTHNSTLPGQDEFAEVPPQKLSDDSDSPHDEKISGFEIDMDAFEHIPDPPAQRKFGMFSKHPKNGDKQARRQMRRNSLPKELHKDNFFTRLDPKTQKVLLIGGGAVVLSLLLVVISAIALGGNPPAGDELSETPTPMPTATPSPAPSASPSPEPSEYPTYNPFPAGLASVEPSHAPAPTKKPKATPKPPDPTSSIIKNTPRPTAAPTPAPTPEPTPVPPTPAPTPVPTPASTPDDGQE